MNKIIEKLINKAEDIGWSVTVDKNFITFQKYSPAGQDFCFDIDMTDYEDENDLIQADLLIEEIHFRVDDFDPSYEAYLWLDDTGHGRSGAPYNMRDVYDDMEASGEMLENLLSVLSDYYHDLCDKEGE